jgi:hypothetical protein
MEKFSQRFIEESQLTVYCYLPLQNCIGDHNKCIIDLIFPNRVLKKYIFVRQVVIPAKAGIHNLLILYKLDSR